MPPNSQTRYEIGGTSGGSSHLFSRHPLQGPIPRLHRGIGFLPFQGCVTWVPGRKLRDAFHTRQPRGRRS